MTVYKYVIKISLRLVGMGRQFGISFIMIQKPSEKIDTAYKNMVFKDIANKDPFV